MKIVSNSSPLIALAKIEMLDILRNDIFIPKAVFDEIKKKIRISKELYDHALELAHEVER